MKESEFIELLNLYLDHEIGAADAARLEAEVHGNPARRQVYLQYCRMQKACTLLAKDFSAQAPETDAAGRKVSLLESTNPSWGPGLWAAGGLIAVAACVALVFMTRAPVPMNKEIAVAAATPAIAPASRATTTIFPSPTAAPLPVQIGKMVALSTVSKTDIQPALPPRGLTLASQNEIDDPAATAEVTAKFDWISGLQIAPMQRVQVEDLRFETRPAQPQRIIPFGNQRRPDQGVVEMTAFQIQK